MPKVKLSALLARQKEFESPTFRLGGGRSILLSYWRICNYRYIVSKLLVGVNIFRWIFSSSAHILSGKSCERRTEMKETDNVHADLDDMIFDEEEYYPSDR